MSENRRKSVFNASRFDGFYMDPNEVVLVGGNGPNDVPRTPELAHLYDKRVEWKPDEGIVLSIMTYGVQEPVLVTKIGESAYGVDGRQRINCSREANRRLQAEGKEQIRVPVVVKKGDPSKLFGIAITANEARIDDTPVEKAEKIVQYMDMGRSEEEAAITFRMSVANLRQLIKVFDLAPAVLKMVRSGELKTSAAIQLVDLPPEEQIKKVEELLVSGVKPTARNVRAAASKVVAPQRRTILKMLKLETKPPVKPEYDSFWGALMLMTGQITAEDAGLQDVIEQLASKPAKAEKTVDKTEAKAEETAEAMLDEPEPEEPLEVSSPDAEAEPAITPPKHPVVAKRKRGVYRTNAQA